MKQLKEKFIALKIQAGINQKAHSEFIEEMAKTKYYQLEMPDEVVEVLDYGRANMTFERFIEIMDDELKTQRS